MLGFGQLNTRKIFFFSWVGCHPETNQLGNIFTGIIHFHNAILDFSTEGMKIVYYCTHDNLSHLKSILNIFLTLFPNFFSHASETIICKSWHICINLALRSRNIRSEPRRVNAGLQCYVTDGHSLRIKFAMSFNSDIDVCVSM